MNAEDWRAVIDEFGLSGKVSRTQLGLAAEFSDSTSDVTRSMAQDDVAVAVDAGLLVERDGPTHADRPLSFRVTA